MPTSHLLYLHGFRSSPQSAKAQKMAAEVALQHPRVLWWCPQLPPSPEAAMHMVMSGVADWPRASMAVVGSSLGGFYATHVAETCACKAVLLNPAVHPARDLEKYIGEQTAWHNPSDRFFFESRFIEEFRALQHGPVARPSDYFSIIAKGDEVLNWREMTGRYAGTRIKLLEGGDHAISDFDAHLPDIMDFLALV